jgi:hypothetical protein
MSSADGYDVRGYEKLLKLPTTTTRRMLAVAALLPREQNGIWR